MERLFNLLIGRVLIRSKLRDKALRGAQTDLVLFAGEILVDLDELYVDIVRFATALFRSGLVEPHFFWEVWRNRSQLACFRGYWNGSFEIGAAELVLLAGEAIVAFLVEAQKIWVSITSLGLAWTDKLIRAVPYRFQVSRGITTASS